MRNYDLTGKWIQIGRYWVRLSDGFRLPIIQGSGPANTVQNDRYAFGDDDGNEAGHTLDSENTDRAAQITDTTFMIRIQVEETAGGTENLPAALHVRVNGIGTFDAVTTVSTNGIILANDTQGRADDENTTERLTAGAGTWTPGKYDDGQTQLGTTAVGLDGEYTEFEFAIQIDSANASDGDDFEFRVETTAGGDLDGYPGTYPTATASISAPLSVQLNTLELNSNHQSLGDVTPGAASVNLDSLSLVSLAEILNVDVVVAQTVTLNTLVLESKVTPVSISSAAVTIALDTLEILSFIEDILLLPAEATIALDTLVLQTQIGDLTISPSAVSQSLDTLELVSDILQASVNIGAGDLTVSLNTLELFASPQRLDVQFEVLIFAKRPVGRRYAYQPKIIGGREPSGVVPPSPQTVTLNTLTLTSNVGDITIFAGAVSQSLNTLELRSAAVPLSIDVGWIFPFFDGFETGDISEWDDSFGTPDINTNAALVGTYGFEIYYNQQDFVILNWINTTHQTYRTKFRIDINDLAGDDGDTIHIFQFRDGAINVGFIYLGYSSSQGSWHLQLYMRNDAGGYDPGGKNHFSGEVEVEAEFIFRDINGFATIWIDGVQGSGITDSDTGTRYPDNARFGAVTLSPSPNSGSVYLDQFNLYNTARAQTFSVDTLSLEASTQALVVSPASVTTTLDTLLLASYIDDLSVVIGAATISTDTLILNSQIEDIVVSPDSVTTTMDTLILNGQAGDIVISPAAVSTSLDTLELISFAETLSIAIGANFIILDSLQIESEIPDLSVVPSAVSIQLDELILIGQIPDLTVSGVAALTVLLNEIILTSNIDAITISAEAVSIVLDELILNANAGNIDVLIGAVSVLLESLTVTSEVGDISVVPGAVSIQLDTLALEAIAVALGVSPGAVSTLLDTLELYSSAEQLNIVIGAVTVLLQSLSAQFNIPDAIVTSGAVTTALDTLELTSYVDDIFVVTTTPTVALDTLVLQSQAISLAIAPAAVSLSLDTLILNGQAVDLIAKIVQAYVAGGVAISDKLISDILLSDELISDLLLSDNAIGNVIISDGDHA